MFNMNAFYRTMHRQ